jgi:hypothetical protein
MPKIKIVVISITSPIQIGLYKENILFETIFLKGQSSDQLPSLFKTFLFKYIIEDIVYTNGPGSFMAIKLGYLFFKTLEITQNIKLWAVDGFYFNKNAPIKALGKLVFIKKDDKIEISNTTNLDKDTIFSLPSKWIEKDFNSNTEPLYILPAV